MRLARLVAAGLVVGVITGFAVALLRPQRSTPQPPADEPTPSATAQPPAVPDVIDPDAEPSQLAELSGPSETVVLDVRTRRPVNG